MSFNIRNILYTVRSNFWFIPSLLALAAVVVAIYVVELDAHLQEKGIAGVKVGEGMPVSNVREILSTIAGSMITVATLVFSMTLVALTMISQQLGPRILLQFMDDRPTQLMLGLFLATFLYALLVMDRTGRWNDNYRVTGIAVLIAMTLSIVSMGAMIHFIHHVATRIQADVLINELGQGLRDAANRALEREQKASVFLSVDERVDFEQRIASPVATQVSMQRSGYLNYFNRHAALSLAKREGLIINVLKPRSSFLLVGEPVFIVARQQASDGHDDRPIEPELVTEIRNTITLGRRRTPEASVTFEIYALAEVALRALSPGVNDPHTAMTCVDWLSDGIEPLLELSIRDNSVFRDKQGNVRIMQQSPSFEGSLSAAFDEIHRFARGNIQVQLKLVDTYEAFLNQTRNPQHVDAIRFRLQAIRADVPVNAFDRSALLPAVDRALALCDPRSA